MSVKRKIEFDVSEVDAAHENVTIHGVVGCLSPIKESKKQSQTKYFNGAISDGHKTLRMVSFVPALREELQKQEKSTVALVNCLVKKSRFVQNTSSEVQESPQYEVFLTNRTKVIASPSKKFRVTTSDLDANSTNNVPSTISVEELQLVALNNRITLSAKVLIVGDAETVTTKDERTLHKQECVIGDDSGTCRIVLWEQDIGRLSLHNTYHMENLTTRMFDGKKYVSVSANTTIAQVDDIQTVAVPDLNDVGVKRFVGEIAGVMTMNEYFGCIACNGKVNQQDSSSLIGECTKCSMKIKIKKCAVKRVAKVKIIKSSGGEIVDATFFDDQLKKLFPPQAAAADEEDLMEKLLNVDSINVCINSKNIVTDVCFQ